MDDTLLGDLAEVRDIIEPAGARLAALRRSDDEAAEAAVRVLLEQAARDLGALRAGA